MGEQPTQPFIFVVLLACWLAGLCMISNENITLHKNKETFHRAAACIQAFFTGSYRSLFHYGEIEPQGCLTSYLISDRYDSSIGASSNRLLIRIQKPRHTRK